MNKLLSISIITVMLSALVSPALADDFVPADQAENATNQFILDADNTGGNVTLQFGTTLAEYLQWNDGTSEFELSDDLNLLNHQLKQFRVENLASDPGTCDVSVEGKLYFNTSSDVLTVCSNLSWTSVSGGGSGGGSIDEKNIVYVDTQRAAQAGEVYATIATAITYVNTQSPGTSNPWVIYVQPGTNTETVTVPVSTVLVGHDYTKNLFTGDITLDNGASLQNATVSGELYVSGGDTAYVYQSDVVLGDGAGGGVDGTLSMTRSFADGEIDVSGIVMAYDSYIGVAAFTNAGTLSTYNSSVFNLTNTGTWNNFGVAYRNTVLATGSRLTSSTTQGAIDELVVGTPTPTFTLNVDETGNPDQNVDIVAEQGTEANGTLRYDDGNNRWELSNNGGSFEKITSLFGTEFNYAESDTVSTTTSTSFQQKLRLTTTSLPAGNYHIEWSYQWNHDATDTGFEARVEVDDSTGIQYHQQEPQDSGGTFGSTGTNQQHTSSGFKRVALGAGVHTVDLDYRTNDDDDESSIWNARIILWRVP